MIELMAVFLSGMCLGAMAYFSNELAKRRKWFSEECRKLDSLVQSFKETQKALDARISSVEFRQGLERKR